MTILLLLGGLAASGCRGYRVGTQSLFSQDVQTVHVPIFKSESFRQGIAERLTEAVIKRIEEKSSYKVVARSNADSTLLGELVSETSGILLNSPEGDPRQKALQFVVRIQWVDRRHRQLRQFEEISWNDTTAQIGTTTIVVPEFGHSQATAEQAAIDRVANQIVGMMELPW